MKIVWTVIWFSMVLAAFIYVISGVYHADQKEFAKAAYEIAVACLFTLWSRDIEKDKLSWGKKT